MKRWFAIFGLPALLAATGPTPLITGAVRDQLGQPISGASVQAGADLTHTDAGGTFALEARAVQVRISCNYCQTTQARVDSDGTVAAIVERYQAVAAQTISPAELRSLPYAHVESAFSLQPFVVLNDSARVLPGPRLSYYGLSRFGGLLVDDGIPSYDIAAGVTPLRTVPAFDAAAIDASDQTQAFRYGDLASGGSFFVQTQPQNAMQGSVLNGTQRAFDFAQNERTAAFNAASSADEDDSRARADASLQFPIGADTLSATALASRDADAPGDSVYGSITAVRLHFDRVRSAHTYADVTADRAGYTSLASTALGVKGEWSDLSLDTGVASNGNIATFADLGVRFSSGYYDPSTIGQPRIAGRTLQTHLSLGAQSQVDRLSWRAGIGAFDIAYAGGALGTSTPLTAQILAPSASISYEVAPQWDVTIDANQSFRLPTLAETYGYAADDSGGLYFDRYGTRDAKLTFTDLRRLRISLIGMNSHVSYLDNGTVSAAGASIAWQIAPQLSLRAWTLHFDDTSLPYAPIFRYGALPQPATPASVWTTYENSHGLRADVIWREDLIDYRPDTHVDASISAPLTGGFRWFIGSERRHGERYVEAGLRLAK